MEFNWIPTALEVGGGGILGFITGYAAKKVIKIAVALVGLGLLGLKYLELKGYLSVNWSKFSGSAGDVVQTSTGQALTLGQILVDTIPLLGSFGVGALLGFKQG